MSDNSTQETGNHESAEPVAEATEAVTEQSATDESNPVVRSGRESPSLATKPEGTSSLYIGNLFFEVTPEEIEQTFSAVGPVKSLKIIRDSRGLSKGFGFIEFEQTADAAVAIDTLDQTVLQGRRMTVQWHTPRTTGVRSSRSPSAPTSTLFIGNMSFEMTDKELTELFRTVRNVTDVRVAIDRRTGQPRGFAHADFTDVESAIKAKEYLSGKEIHGRNLVTDFAASSRDVRASQPIS